MQPLDFIHNFLDQTRDAATRAAEVESIRQLILGPRPQAPEQAWKALRTVFLDTGEAAEVRQAVVAALRRISRMPNQPWQAKAETLLTPSSWRDLYRESEFVLELASLWQELSLLDLLLLPGQDPWYRLMQLRAQLKPLFELEPQSMHDPLVRQALVRRWREQSITDLFNLPRQDGQTHREDPRLLRVLQYAARHPDPEVRQRASASLAWVGQWPLVVQALQDEASDVRAAAASDLGMFARGTLSPPLSAEVTTALEAALQDNDATVRRFALQALRLLKVRPLPVPPSQPVLPPPGEAGAALLRFPWRSFLATWSWRLLQLPEDHLPLDILELPDVAFQSGWIGSPGATQAQLLAAEQRLGRRLPPSYREFLQLTNGWPCGLPEPLLPIEQVDRFQVKDPDFARAWIEDWEREGLDLSEADHRVYGEQQDPSYFHFDYLQTAFQISEQQDGYVYLLNPEVVTPEGEWEAWMLGTKILGAQRWASFWEMMQEESRTEFPGKLPSDAEASQEESLPPEE